MPSQEIKAKVIVIQKIWKKATQETLKIIEKHSKISEISAKHIQAMFVPKFYREVKKRWEKADKVLEGHIPFPITFKDIIKTIEERVKTCLHNILNQLCVLITNGLHTSHRMIFLLMFIWS